MVPRSAVVEARCAAPAHRHTAGHAFHRAHQLAHRVEAIAGQRHGVEQPHGSRVGRKRGLQNVGARKVPPCGLKRNGRTQRKAAAAGGVEECGERTRRVEVRQAEPIDGAVFRDERRRPPVADDRVVLDGCVAVDAHEASP